MVGGGGCNGQRLRVGSRTRCLVQGHAKGGGGGVRGGDSDTRVCCRSHAWAVQPRAVLGGWALAHLLLFTVVLARVHPSPLRETTAALSAENMKARQG